MVMFCPWCGAPIPDELLNEFESVYSTHSKEIVCIRCRTKTFLWGGCEVDDTSIAHILDKEEI